MHKKFSFMNRRFSIYIFWIVGFIIGLSIASYITSHRINTPYVEYDLDGSLGSILILSVFPIFIALVAWKFNLDILSDMNLLVNSFLYGFCSLYLSRTTGLSGSFVHLLFMFSTGSCTTLLVYLCSILYNMFLQRHKKLLLCILIAAFILCCLDYFVILRFFT